MNEWDELNMLCREMNMYKKSLENDEEFWAEVLADPTQKIACVRSDDDD